MAVVFEEVESGLCTDTFTQNLLLNRLAPVIWIETILYWIIRAVCLLGVVSSLQNIVIVPNSCYGIITKTVPSFHFLSFCYDVGVCDSGSIDAATQ